MERTSFDLSSETSSREEDFLVSTSNSFAYAMVLNDEAWPDGRLVLVGPAGSGKTHLARVWAEKANANLIRTRQFDVNDAIRFAMSGNAVLEDINDIGFSPEFDLALLHLCNMLAAEGGKILITAREPPSRWRTTLPDLQTRLEACQLATIGLPDGELLAGLIVKLFSDRQMSIDPLVANYIARRMERSYSAAHSIVEALDRKSLAAGRRATRAMAAEVLSAVDLN